MKICTKCKMEKEDLDFNKRSDNGKLQSWCKSCTKSLTNKETRAIYRNQDRERYRALKRASRGRNKETYLLKNARMRSKKENLEYNIERNDIVIPEFCPVFGIPINLENKDNNPSLDRIDSNKGYIKGNIIVVSYRANRLKKDSTDEERKKLMDYYGQLGRI